MLVGGWLICRYLALVGALATEADYVFIPEWPAEADWHNKLCRKLTQAIHSSSCSFSSA